MSDLSFEKANEKVHLVEDQWHYKYMIKYGFVPVTKTGVGFVRSYIYERPDGEKITCTTGYSADYWSVTEGTPSTQKKNYWANLEPHLKTLPQL